MLILESGSLLVFAEVSFAFIPFILLQNDSLLFADLDPFFNLDGLVVTAVCNLEPGFSRRYALTAFLLTPSVLSLRFTFCQSSPKSSLQFEGDGLSGYGLIISIASTSVNLISSLFQS